VETLLKNNSGFRDSYDAPALVPEVWAGAKYSVLYKFKGGRNGAGPNGALVADAAGNLYGVTATGGYGKNEGCGTVFEVSGAGNGWDQKVLYRFPGNGKDGCIPIGNLTFDVKGNLYGTTSSGGQGNCSGQTCGTVFELTPNAGGNWKHTVLHRFTGGSDGEFPTSSVVLDAAGNVYGTTGGGDTSCGCGTVFELTPLAGGGWTKTILHAFGGADGANPSGLVFDAVGNLYGEANIGGLYDEGVAFELSPSSGGGWNESTIYNFQGFSGGAGPGNGLTFEGRNLYGATSQGGDGWGTIFELAQGANGWTHSVLYSFTGRKDGRYPYGPFVFDKTGNLYGITGGDVGCLHGYHWKCGNVFELMPESGGPWKLQVLHTFPGGSVGSFPSQLEWGEHGGLFGVAGEGGVGPCEGGGWSGCGLAFEVRP
jgi:uncharacterized repeat protein (TIGR03803 family)